MKIWIDDSIVLDRPRIKWFDAETVVSVLEGFAIMHGMPIKIQAMYRPLLIIDKRKGYLRIELATSGVRGKRILLRRKRPFIITETLDYEKAIHLLRHDPPWKRR